MSGTPTYQDLARGPTMGSEWRTIPELRAFGQFCCVFSFSRWRLSAKGNGNRSKYGGILLSKIATRNDKILALLRSEV